MTTNPSFHVKRGALKKIETVLIGASLTEPYNRVVVESGLTVASALQARAHVQHCVWPNSLGMSGFDFEAFFEERKAEVLPSLRAIPGADGPGVTIGIDVGAPYASLLRAAEELGADLIVVGPVENPRRRLGSTAEKIMRKANCPILIVREPVTLPFRRVLAPVDLSTLSADSLRCGLSFLDQAVANNRPELEVLFVLNELQRHFGWQFSEEQVDRFAREELSRFVDENTGGDERGGTRHTLIVGDERDEILKTASERSPDLILLGTHGRGGVERALIGSVAASVVRRVDGNVLVIPPATAFGSELADAIVEQTAPSWGISASTPRER